MCNTHCVLYCIFLTGNGSLVAYNEAIGKIELLTKSLFSALGITVVIVFFVAEPYSFVRYYVFDKDEDSFYLFAPSWFVLNYKAKYVQHEHALQSIIISKVSI